MMIIGIVISITIIIIVIFVIFIFIITINNIIIIFITIVFTDSCHRGVQPNRQRQGVRLQYWPLQYRQQCGS